MSGVDVQRSSRSSRTRRSSRNNQKREKIDDAIDGRGQRRTATKEERKHFYAWSIALECRRYNRHLRHLTTHTNLGDKERGSKRDVRLKSAAALLALSCSRGTSCSPGERILVFGVLTGVRQTLSRASCVGGHVERSTKTILLTTFPSTTYVGSLACFPHDAGCFR